MASRPVPRTARRWACRLARRLIPALAIAAAASAAQAARFDLVLSPTGDGRTRMDFSASGSTGTAAAGSDFTWSNLNGGNPFDVSLNFASFSFDPISTQSGRSLVGLTLDSDGGAATVGQDDLTLRFDALVFGDDVLTAAPSSRTLDLAFALLTPGEYSRVTDAGALNLSILASPVPWPPSAALLLGGLVLLAAARSGALRRRPGP